MTTSNVSQVAILFANYFYNEHRTVHTNDGDRVDLEALAFIFQHCIDEHINRTNVPKHKYPCAGSNEGQSDELLQHVPCIIAAYSITDEDWDATPTTLQTALLLQCAALSQ